MQGPSYLQVFHPWIQPTTDWQQYFCIPSSRFPTAAQILNCSWLNSWIWRADCTVKSYTWIFDCTGNQHPEPPCCLSIIYTLCDGHTATKLHKEAFFSERRPIIKWCMTVFPSRLISHCQHDVTDGMKMCSSPLLYSISITQTQQTQTASRA